MSDKKRVILDGGHGGRDPGAVYYGRQEKDDVLNLALSIGGILADEGIDVIYTRLDDTYHTPCEKAAMGNGAEADYFISLHRNAAAVPNTGSGVESLVFENTGVSAKLAKSINAALQEAGFSDRGVMERPRLAVLRRTNMPSVLVEAGFIDNEADNRFFDRNFKAIAEGIAHGILAAIEQEEAMEDGGWQIEAGAYQDRGLAEQLLTQLQSQGYPAFLAYEGGYYKVRAGVFGTLEHAKEMEQILREDGYAALIAER